MKETGIIMSRDHPRLILDGLKTMTRRTWGLERLNKTPDAWESVYMEGAVAYFWYSDPYFVSQLTPFPGLRAAVKCPYGGVGDRLWVRENWSIHWVDNDGRAELRVYYFGGGFQVLSGDKAKLVYMHSSGRPSIHMPRWASRILLEITAVRAERLRAITPIDAIREGYTTIEEFIEIFLKLNHLPDDADPWVWPISFRIVNI